MGRSPASGCSRARSRRATRSGASICCSQRCRRFAGAEVDVRAVAGDHYSMLRAPAVEGLARELQELLEEATPR